MKNNPATQKAYMRNWRKSHQKEIQSYIANYRNKNRAKLLVLTHLLNREASAIRKREAFNAYGGPICVCCGEENEDFLSIEHSRGDGKTHRAEMGEHVYRWLAKRGYPSGLGLEVLCMNCQLGRRLNRGHCPHETFWPDHNGVELL